MYCSEFASCISLRNLVSKNDNGPVLWNSPVECAGLFTSVTVSYANWCYPKFHSSLSHTVSYANWCYPKFHSSLSHTVSYANWCYPTFHFSLTLSVMLTGVTLSFTPVSLTVTLSVMLTGVTLSFTSVSHCQLC